MLRPLGGPVRLVRFGRTAVTRPTKLARIPRNSAAPPSLSEPGEPDQPDMGGFVRRPTVLRPLGGPVRLVRFGRFRERGGRCGISRDPSQVLLETK